MQFKRPAGPDNLENLDDFLAQNGVARSTDAHDPDSADKVTQGDATDYYHTQMVMTDFPWHFGQDDLAGASNPQSPATQAARAFFDACEMKTGPNPLTPVPPCKFNSDALTEPGNRILTGPGDGGLAVTVSQLGTDTWETGVSGTAPTHDNKLYPFGTPGSTGCLFASSAKNSFAVCRRVDTDRSRTVHVSGWSTGFGTTSHFDYVLPHQHSEPSDIGDLLKMEVVRTLIGTLVSVQTAAVVGPDSRPIWVGLPTGGFIFNGDWLTTQGVSSSGQSLFVGTKHNNASVTKSFFSGVWPSADSAFDQSFCLDRSCRSNFTAAGRYNYVLGSDQEWYYGVHEAAGQVYNQSRHLYTSDLFELMTSGFDSQRQNAFYLRYTGPADVMSALYKCTDWRSDYHTYWLSTNASCPNDKGPAGLNAGYMGAIFNKDLGSMFPLYRLRRGTQNAGSDNTHDHVLAVGLAEATVWIANGYELVETLGFVMKDPTQPHS
jgi:hypothetical protein